MASGNIAQKWNNCAQAPRNGYCKMPDGTLLQWESKDFTITASSQYGSLYYSAQLTLPDWEVAFYGITPKAFLSVEGTSDVFVGRLTGNSTTTVGKIYVYSPVSLSNKDVTINVFGIGRWKA